MSPIPEYCIPVVALFSLRRELSLAPNLLASCLLLRPLWIPAAPLCIWDAEESGRAKLLVNALSCFATRGEYLKISLIRARHPGAKS